MAVVEVGAVSVHEARYEVLSADAHHPVGLLTFPSTVDGASLVPCDAIALRLTISGVDGDPRVFEWTGAPVVAAARP
jgi:hypothetical protein